MTAKTNILIVDSNTNRREDLSKMWSGITGAEVVFYAGGDFFRFQNEGSKATILLGNEVDKISLSGCLFHLNDLQQYDDARLKTVVDSCQRIVLFSGVGIAGPQAEWPQNWFWIPRAISGSGSAKERQWRQLGDWFATKPLASADGAGIELLSVQKELHFLIALYILCQGFLAAERMPKRIPTAIAHTRKREWWSVPLLQSVGNSLVDVVKEEWRGKLPPSVSRLVEWIAAEPERDEPDLAEIVAKAKEELECRISK